MDVKIVESNNDELVLDIKGDDHTVSNLIKSRVVNLENVTFAGYSKEHQLKDKSKLVVKTNKGKPITVVKSAVASILKDLASVKVIK